MVKREPNIHKNYTLLGVLSLVFLFIAIIIGAVVMGIFEHTVSGDCNIETGCDLSFDKEVGDVTETGDWLVAVTEMSISDSYETLLAETGKQYVIVKVIFQNMSSTKSQTVGANFEFYVDDRQGNKYLVNSDASKEVGVFDTNITYAPQDMTETTLVFQTPEGLKNLIFVADVLEYGRIVVPVTNTTVEIQK